MTVYTDEQWKLLQERAVDAYRTPESSAVNKLTRMVSGGKNIILDGLLVEDIDPTTLRITKGIAIKDDVLIQFNEDIYIDLTDGRNYWPALSETPNPLDIYEDSGYYYVSINYKFYNARPAPFATVKISPPGTRIDTKNFLTIAIFNTKKPASSWVIDEILYSLPYNHATLPVWKTNDTDNGEIKSSLLVSGLNLVQEHRINSISYGEQTTPNVCKTKVEKRFGTVWKDENSGNIKCAIQNNNDFS